VYGRVDAPTGSSRTANVCRIRLVGEDLPARSQKEKALGWRNKGLGSFLVRGTDLVFTWTRLQACYRRAKDVAWPNTSVSPGAGCGGAMRRFPTE